MRNEVEFQAKRGTTFWWDPNDPKTLIDISAAPFPVEDLEEFIAHIVSQAAEETLGRVLLFPCLRKPTTPPKDAA